MSKVSANKCFAAGLLPKIYPVACHTDNIGPGSTFVAIKGQQSDGARFIDQAIDRGATKVIVDQVSDVKQCAVVVERVENTRKALALESARALNYPAKKLKILAITGTKGKTTTAWLLYHLLYSSGKKVALLSTVHNKINGVVIPTTLTTRQPDYLHVFFDACVTAGVEYVVMEVAAQAFTFDRVDGLEFEHALFTNFSAEHAELYPDQSDYFAAKAKIADYVKPSGRLFFNSSCTQVAQFCVKLGNAVDCLDGVSDIHLSRFGSQFSYVLDEKVYSFEQPLLGLCNVHNACDALSIAHACGISSSLLQKNLKSFQGIPGRMEPVSLPNGAVAYIDFAHTVCSYHAILLTLREFTEHLIVVFGCGGDRDATKRVPMGACVAQYADVAIVTSDNPRNEDPEKIIDQVLAGVASGDVGSTDLSSTCEVIRESDRRAAIACAYKKSHQGSVIAILGKGPDEYQIIKGQKFPFNDKNVLCSLV